MKGVVFTSVPFFLSEIYSWKCYFYIIKGKVGTPNTNTYPTTSENEYQEKKLPMDYDNVNRWYNIGIIP